MKTILCLSLLAAAAAVSAYADDGYMVLRVCQDQHIIHTSDGVDAGHLGYVLIDPDSDQLVSVVVTGGVLGDRFVPIPIADFRFGTNADVTLTSIDREHLVDAPVIDTTRFTSTTYVQPAVIDNTYRHFGADLSTIRRGQGGQTTMGENRGNPSAATTGQTTTGQNERNETDRERATAAFGGSRANQNSNQNRLDESGTNSLGHERQNRTDTGVNTSSANHRAKAHENSQATESRDENTPRRLNREENNQQIGGGVTTESTPSSTRTEKESTNASEKAGHQMESRNPDEGTGTRTQSETHTPRQDKQSDTEDQSR